MGTLCVRQNEEQLLLRELNTEILQTIKEEAGKLKTEHKWALLLSTKYGSLKSESLLKSKYLVSIDRFAKNNPSLYLGFAEDKLTLELKSDDSEVKNSCIIAEDELNNTADRSNDLLIPSRPLTDDLSFNEHANQNPSVIMQMSVIYKAEFPEQRKFNDSIKRFLQWSQIASEQLREGFLSPLYKLFAHDLNKEIQLNFQRKLDILLSNIAQSCTNFINMMIVLYKKIYSLEAIAKQQNGEMFKYETLFNFTMTHLFSRTSIGKSLKDLLSEKLQPQIDLLSRKMAMLKDKPISVYNIPVEFMPFDSVLSEMDPSPKLFSTVVTQILEISRASTPISKVKSIILVSKRILSDINNFYHRKGQEAPNLDPDSITSIMMYVIVQSNYSEILVDIQIIESFSSRNCMNCVSGYYIRLIRACCQMIQESQ